MWIIPPLKLLQKKKIKQKPLFGLFSEGVKSVSELGEMSGVLQSVMGNWFDYVIHSPEIELCY